MALAGESGLAMDIFGPAPGDLLLVRSPGPWARLIRLGAALRDEPQLDNHVAIYRGPGPNGTPMATEGRPGGVGSTDARRYLRSPWTVTNLGQPKTAAQRKLVCDIAVKMDGTQYDWSAICDDALKCFGMPLREAWNLTDGQVPGHVVCSSLAAYAYLKAGLTCPPGDRLVSPGDWLQLIISHGWNA